MHVVLWWRGAPRNREIGEEGKRHHQRGLARTQPKPKRGIWWLGLPVRLDGHGDFNDK